MDSQSAQHEFTDAENQVLRKAATWTGLFAWMMMVSSGLMAVAGLLSGEATSIGALIAAAIYFAVGFTFRGAAKSMGEVVRTTGNDIDHLMDAVDKLGSAFKVMGIVFLVGAVASVIATVGIWSWMSSLS
jgi:hypothetical protein